jgi:hypothetical protein
MVYCQASYAIKQAPSLVYLKLCVAYNVTVNGIFFISKSGHWQDLAGALIGFVITRSVLIRTLPIPIALKTTNQKSKESAHAS